MSRMLMGLAVVTFAATASASPSLQYTGRVLDSAGAALNGPIDLTVTLYDGDGVDATDYWAKLYTSEPVENGYFSVILTTSTANAPINTAWLTSDLWVGVSVGGAELSRTQLVDAPRAAVAARLPVATSPPSGECTDAGMVQLDFATNTLVACSGTEWRTFGISGVVLVNGARQWPNNQLAESCRDYNEPPVGFFYTAASQDGLYRIDPDGGGTTFTPMVVYCDQTSDGGGWTRVSTIFLDTTCNMSTAASGDPSAGGNCTKYSDAAINDIAQDKIFVSRIPGYNPTYTKYAGSIQVGGNPGNVVQGGTLSSVASASTTYTPGYGGWRFFHQQNWYETDRCLGAPASTARLSFEYISSTGLKYACTSACGSECSATTRVDGLMSEIYIR